MGASLESRRPIMAPSIATKRASARYSTYSMAPTVQTTTSVDLIQQELTYISEGLDKLENKKLASQRFVPSKEKSENLSKLALGAKLERALDRRLGGQDAVMRKKVVKTKEAESENEKV